MAAGRTRTWPDMPLKVRLMLAAHTFSVNASTSSNTVNRPVSNLFDPRVPASRKPVDGIVSSDIVVDANRKLWFRLYTNTDCGDARVPVLVYFHGGGFAFFAANSKSYDELCRRLAREIPAVVISVNYRRTPEHKYPSQYEDGLDVLKFIDSPGFEGLPASAKLEYSFLAGDSAGGNIAHHVAVRAAEHQFSKLKLLGNVLIQPFFGGEERTETETRLVGAPLISVKRTDWMWKALLPDGSNRDHAVVNVFGPNSVDISGVQFPGTLVIMGGYDPLQDWQRRYIEGLKKSGKQVHVVEYPNAFHGFFGFPELPEYPLLIAEMKSFVRKEVGAEEVQFHDFPDESKMIEIEV